MPTETSKPDAQRVLAAAKRMPGLSMMFRRLTPRQHEIIALLKRTTIFADLSRSEFIELLHLLHERVFVQGEIVFNEGEPGLGLYVVFKGEVEIGNLKHDGKGKVARLGPSEVFGEVSFLDGGTRSATVIAGMKTELLGFYRTELFNLLERKPTLASKILIALARQMGLRMRAMLRLLQP
jgi:CRP/FNR family cyclic AMP-dependent transcriptional regulator